MFWSEIVQGFDYRAAYHQQKFCGVPPPDLTQPDPKSTRYIIYNNFSQFLFHELSLTVHFCCSPGRKFRSFEIPDAQRISEHREKTKENTSKRQFKYINLRSQREKEDNKVFHFIQRHCM